VQRAPRAWPPGRSDARTKHQPSEAKRLRKEGAKEER
jgi:hypothetical protein